MKVFVFTCYTAVLLSQYVLGGEKAVEWDHHKVLDEDAMYHLYWTVQKNTITFQLEFATSGWIGFGRTRSGGIGLSDIVIGWVDGSKVMVYDYFAKDDVTLVLDKQQDLKIMSGSENKTHTVLRFSRSLDTCDNLDYPINNDTQHLIFATYPEDPVSPNAVNFRQVVWMKSDVKLLNPKFKKIPMPDDVLIWDLRADNFTIPANESTFYYCRMYKTPAVKKKHHVIKYTTFIRPQNIDMVNHIVLNKCIPVNKTDTEAALKYGGAKCFQPWLPTLFSRCIAYFVAWAKGGNPFVYPSHVGYPIEEETEYYMFEIHYYNPTFRKGFVDDSGVRVYYTPKVRKYDSAVIAIATSPLITVTNVFPPGQKEFVGVSHAPPDCLSQGMPPKGVNIFAVLLHGHDLTTKIKLRHFRGKKELPPIAMDMQFRNNHEEYNFLSKDVKVLPEDQLTVECSSDTRSRTVASLNGLGTTYEMCFALLFHYTPLLIDAAFSYPPLQLIAGLTGMNLSAADYITAVEPGYPNANYKEYLEDYDWADSEICLFQKAVRYSPLGLICHTINFTILPVTQATYPEGMKPYIFPDVCKKKGPQQQTELGARCNYQWRKRGKKM